MSTERETTRLVRSWLEEGVTALPDRVLDAVIDQVPATRQRRHLWPVRRDLWMNTYAKMAIAAASVLLLAFVGVRLLPSTTVGPPSVTPTPVSAQTPEPTEFPLVPAQGAIEAGTYRMGAGPTLVITLPPGWIGNGSGDIRKNAGRPNELGLLVWAGDLEVFTDACQSEGTETAIGPTANDLLTALRDQENYDISDPVDVTIGSVAGKQVEVSVPAGLNVADCSIGSLQIWKSSQGGYFAGVGAESSSGKVYFADTPQGRIAFGPASGSGASATDIAEVDAIIKSIRLE